MNQHKDKTIELSEAVAKYIHDGDHISIGGFTINRNPMAAVYEIIRQRKKQLHIYAHSNGQGVDELIGAGCASKIEIAYAGSGRFAPTCIRFKKAVQDQTLLVEDYSNYQMTLRFQAGAMGVPFLPTRSSLGTDIIAKWGFPESMRRSDPKIPNQKLCVIDNPFDAWGDASQLVLVPAINPDVTIIHVQKADRQGLLHIDGLTFADVEQAKAARAVIATCENLADPEEMRSHSDANQIPFMCVDAVAHVPHGAYPTACYGCYDYDPVYLNRYRKAAQDESEYQAYLQKYIYNTSGHDDFMGLISPQQIDNIKADPRTGYAVGLDRS